MINRDNYCEEIRIIRDSDKVLADKAVELKRLLERLCKEATQQEAMQFSTLFSRIVYIAQRHNLPKLTEWRLQNFRVGVKKQIKNDISVDTKTYNEAEEAILELCEILSSEIVGKKEVETEVEPKSEKDTSHSSNSKATSTSIEDTIRVQILSIDRDNCTMACAVEKSPGKQVTVRYNVSPDNDIFTPSVSLFKEGAQLNLVDNRVDKNGHIVPKALVLEPDYLIDASAIANCFNDYSISHLNYFMNKFELMENRHYLLMGNLANYFLDELIFADNPDELEFNKVFLDSFKQSPFEYATCEDIISDDAFRGFMGRAQEQFHNIKRVIAYDFPQQNINPRKCTLEPSFFSEKYGFQGRLDLLQTAHNDTPYKIVELKSGGLPYPRHQAGKIALSHEVQTAVYRLMIESVYKQTSRHIDAAILYSNSNNPGENLRFAAHYQQLEKEILNLRNLIVHTELSISQRGVEDVEALFGSLRSAINPSRRTPDFFINKISKIEDSLAQCTPVERLYFYRFVQFISKEMYLQKIGDIAHESPVGVAALWNSEFEERAEALDLLYDLTISSIDDKGSDMKIVFSRTTQQNDLVNFREGDICIVYPRNSEKDNVLNNQILKGVVASIDANEVEVRFRYKQRNKKHFANNSRWAIEHDTMDSSYNSMYKSLFMFINASKRKRDLLLGVAAPTAQVVQFNESTTYTERVVEKAMAAKDYFLIVGPPGTGKTSVFARTLIEKYYADKSKNILVLAYTNRAVNELCDAVNAAFGCTDGGCDKYIRVGTELSCEEPYRDRLLQNIAEKTDSRAALLKELAETRIYISTLSSINGKQELFNLKQFDIAIIDEASQILEPQLMGVLSKVEKFILIGDHNQLATIVLQNEFSSEVKEQPLLDIGVYDCRVSFFERLLQTCKKNKWEDAYIQLKDQGRMHIDISAYPSRFFYEENLFPIMSWQSEPLALMDSGQGEMDSMVANNRVLFLSTEKLHEDVVTNKINHNEATAAVALVQSVLRVYEHSNDAIRSSQIGIIAPYRNQIALIKQQLAEANIPNHEEISVDTVERYQGSQRDIILLSFCVNRAYQLDFLCNLNHDGTVDRKLNVALTRARKQLFMVGNANILRRHPIYATLLDFVKERTFVLEE